MGDDLELDPVAFGRAQDQLSNVYDDLVAEQRALERTMSTLFSDGWTGVAADEFVDGWADWRTGCNDVLDGLVRMNQAMTTVSIGLHLSDTHNHDAIDRVRSRLGGP